MTRCILCGSNYDGCLNEDGDFICVDCWADGSAIGHTAVAAVPTEFPLYVNYPAEMLNRFVDACNKK